MQRLIVARHGESEYSARGALNGDPAIAVKLTAAGRSQALQLGELLANEQIDLCVTSEFVRTHQTAEGALVGRRVPLLAVPELNDHPAGSYEGRPLGEYLRWAHSAGPAETIPGAGESRADVVARFASGFRLLLERPERTVLAVLHALPIVYLLEAAEGRDPVAETPLLPYAEPSRLDAGELKAAVERLERWALSPSW